MSEAATTLQRSPKGKRSTDVGMNLGKVEQRTTTSSVAEVLRKAILSGTFPPGSQLREVAIAHELGVSRAPLREAFALLVDEGLAEKVAFRGTFVAEVSAEVMAEIASLRIKLEPFGISLAVPNLTPERLAALRADVESMREAADVGDMTMSIDAHISFHRRLYEYSGHKMLFDIWKGWESQLQLFLSLDHRGFEDLHELAAEHVRLLDVIETGDMEAVQREVERHVHGAGPLPKRKNAKVHRI
jgi:DNA-binding GntR family transcriptional regulator